MQSQLTKRFSTKTGIVLLMLLFMSFIVPQPKITIWMIGDSTMAKKEAKAYPETGWGMELGNFFDNSVLIENRGLNGRSTKSFIN